MKKFEYSIIKVSSEKHDSNFFESYLNDMSSMGWENYFIIILVLPDKSQFDINKQGIKLIYEYYFKRELDAK